MFLAPYEPSSDDDYDDDQYGIPEHNSYCGFSRNFLEQGLPKPSRRITPEVCFKHLCFTQPIFRLLYLITIVCCFFQEAAKTAKELVDEEENLKRKAEKKKQKKMVRAWAKIMFDLFMITVYVLSIIFLKYCRDKGKDDVWKN